MEDMANRVAEQDPIKPHSPQSNYPSSTSRTGMRLESSSESDSNDSHGENSDSNVSDMIEDTTVRFASIRTKRKSLDGDFNPKSGSSSRSPSKTGSDSESGTGSVESSDGNLVIAENGSVSSRASNSRTVSPQRSRVAAQLSEEESDNGTTNRTSSFYGSRSKQHKFGQSPLVTRDSPFTFKRGNHSNTRESNSRYSYELCPPSFEIYPPRRRAAVNVRYQFSDNESEESNESDVPPLKRNRRQQKRRRRSESEFEVSGESEATSNNISVIDDSEESEEEYHPTRRRGGTKNGSRRQVLILSIAIIIRIWKNGHWN